MNKKPNIKKIIKSKINYNQNVNNPKLNDKSILNKIVQKVVEKEVIAKINNGGFKQKKEIEKVKSSSQDRAFAANVPNFVSSNKKTHSDISVVLKDYGQYKKEASVDFDVVICVTSYERYVKLRRIIQQLYTQETRYTFKFILLNQRK